VAGYTVATARGSHRLPWSPERPLSVGQNLFTTRGQHRHLMRSVRPRGILQENQQRCRLPRQNWGRPLPASLASPRGHRQTGKGSDLCPSTPRSSETGPCQKPGGQVRTFLGQCGYYRGFVDHYSQHAQPLVDLIGGVKKGDPEVSETAPLVLTPAEKESSAYMRGTPFGHPFWHTPNSTQTNLSWKTPIEVKIRIQSERASAKFRTTRKGSYATG
jgi:hypothetical protein